MEMTIDSDLTYEARKELSGFYGVCHLHNEKNGGYVQKRPVSKQWRLKKQIFRFYHRSRLFNLIYPTKSQRISMRCLTGMKNIYSNTKTNLG
ncbi:hypothetical protein V1502_08850 [Bacillus sp. SCS-153A]|uniref:hypothetical protein n=1 Tax=Rossellomorea sedimentorum TaxID=3115294 RepID=UPI00390601DE